MKAVIYILLFSLGLSGICQHAHANTHNRKFTHHASLRLIKEQISDRDNLVADEDEDDQDDFTRKYSIQSKWLSSFANVFLSINDFHSTNKFLQEKQFSYPLSNIYIVLRVLRI